MILYNKTDKAVLKQRLKSETFKRITVSFYKFVQVEDPQLCRDVLYKALNGFQVFGRIYVAPEGVNAQCSVPEPHFNAFENYLQQHPLLHDVLLNKAVDDNGKSFYKLKILVKHKVLSDGLDSSSFDIFDVGEHLDARAYHEKLTQSGTVVVDLRNHYEHEVGHFEGAVLPDVDTYKESLPVIVDLLRQRKPKQVLLYCTGGIRCEKFSAYLRHKGFSKVYQLKGGVVNYARQLKELGIESKFKGKNFVFDDRMGERITSDVIARCHQCGQAADKHVNCANDACHLLFIQCENCAAKYSQCCSAACLEVIGLTEEERKKMRKGKSHPNAHHKSKFRMETKDTGV